jgi:hypothetical protein
MDRFDLPSILFFGFCALLMAVLIACVATGNHLAGG